MQGIKNWLAPSFWLPAVPKAVGQKQSGKVMLCNLAKPPRDTGHSPGTPAYDGSRGGDAPLCPVSLTRSLGWGRGLVNPSSPGITTGFLISKEIGNSVVSTRQFLITRRILTHLRKIVRCKERGRALRPGSSQLMSC